MTDTNKMTRGEHRMPVTVARFAAKHGIAIERGEWGDYLIFDTDTQTVVEMSRTMNPRVCHAMATMRRYLATRAKTARTLDSTLPAPTDAQRKTMRGDFADVADVIVAEMQAVRS